MPQNTQLGGGGGGGGGRGVRVRARGGGGGGGRAGGVLGSVRAAGLRSARPLAPRCRGWRRPCRGAGRCRLPPRQDGARAAAAAAEEEAAAAGAGTAAAATLAHCEERSRDTGSHGGGEERRHAQA